LAIKATAATRQTHAVHIGSRTSALGPSDDRLPAMAAPLLLSRWD
jgi:hypothetical protein